MPLPFPLQRRQRQAEAGFHLVTDDEREQCIEAAHLDPVRERDDRRPDGSTRMDKPRDIRIVVIVDMGHVGMNHRSVKEIEPLRSADHLRLPGGTRSQDVEQHVNSRVTRTDQGQTQPVQEAPLCGVEAFSGNAP